MQKYRRSHIARNFACNVLDGALFAFAMSLVSRTAVLPVFVSKIGGDNVAIGLIPVIWIVGFNLPQLLVANRAQSLARTKPFVLATALVQRLPWLGLALLTFGLFRHIQSTTLLLLFFVAFGLAALAGSINLPAWFELVAKVTPVRLRGRLFALRTVLGSGLGLVGGWLVEQVLEAQGIQEGFAILAGMAFAATMLSYIFLVLLVEESPPDRSSGNTNRSLRSRIPGILREYPNFRNFVVGEALLVAATAVEAFFAVDAFARFDLSLGYAGRFTAVAAGSTMIGSLVFGYMADRFGHKLSMLLSAALLGLSCLSALAAQSIALYYLVFVLAAFSLSLRNISQYAIVAELCNESERPTFVALKNAITAPFILVGLLAGWIADTAGYHTLFWAAAIVAACSALWLTFVVREPRTYLQPAIL